MVAYRLNHDAFLLQGYNEARPFASFLPGIAGLWGIPMWVFYVNRGQAIAGFGIQDKDHPIMEFLPANKAWRNVPLRGFRTFLKVRAGGRSVFHEPFQAFGPRDRATVQRMRIRMHDVELEESHAPLGLDTAVRYFTIPNAAFPALARIVTFTNRTRRPVDLEVLDGLPLITPYGMQDRFLKIMSRTMEAWLAVDNVARRAPFYRLTVEPHDRPEVVPIDAGNFFVACVEEGSRARLLDPVVNPSVVFGPRLDGVTPDAFLAPGFRVPRRQLALNTTPCAMGHWRTRLHAGESRQLYALFGQLPSVAQLNALLGTLTDPRFFREKARENAALIEELTRPIATASGMPAFDLYCRQTFLDNTLRGGVPTSFGPDDAPPGSPRRRIVYVYARKHGDLERDYNQFFIPPTPLSQGDANYRDIHQNRRSDSWFFPEVTDGNILTFFNLIQTDGYNPLVFKGIRYVAPPEFAAHPDLRDILSAPFTPGEVLGHLARRQVRLAESPHAFLARLLSRSRAVEDAEHGEGFWTDHWSYNLEMLEHYLALYPERLAELLIGQRALTFYDNAYVVVPRARRYQVVDGCVRQLQAVRPDREKYELIRLRTSDPHLVRTERGTGEVYRTTLLVKMLTVIANKLASLDPSGIGIEMEADRPNWYDALNGLPALLGSSACETFELKRWMLFVLGALNQLDLPPHAAVTVPEELADLMQRLDARLEGPPGSYWEGASAAKEAYRDQTRLGLSGHEEPLSRELLDRWLRRGIAKVSTGIDAAYDARQGLYHSYFYHEVTTYRRPSNPPAVVPTGFRRRALPLFLQGAVHALRQEPPPTRARALYRAVRRSSLYDRRLRMYRICASLVEAPLEIGRCRIFTPGWLENESIWLHMEYKFLLELLRCGLCEEFYQDFFTVLIPFQPPRRYGRSILENSSFLVSSAYPDPALHGAGYVARLSGASAEFLQMWLWMTLGRTPFTLSADGTLALHIAPILHRRLFDARGRFACTLFGRTRLVYSNPSRRSTFGPGAAHPGAVRLIPRRGEPIVCRGGVVPAPHAARVRAGDFERIEVDLVPAPAGRRRAAGQRTQAVRDR